MSTLDNLSNLWHDLSDESLWTSIGQYARINLNWDKAVYWRVVAPSIPKDPPINEGIFIGIAVKIVPGDYSLPGES